MRIQESSGSVFPRPILGALQETNDDAVDICTMRPSLESSSTRFGIGMTQRSSLRASYNVRAGVGLLHTYDLLRIEDLATEGHTLLRGQARVN